jgi:hypothetical protein
MPYVRVSGVAVAQFMANLGLANIASVCAFAILVTSAILLRGRPEAHKRLMLIASITIIGPALARISRWLPFEGPFVLAVMLLLLAALVIHDLRATKRVHPATLIGGALSILLGGVFTGVMISPFGLALTRSLQ